MLCIPLAHGGQIRNGMSTPHFVITKPPRVIIGSHPIFPWWKNSIHVGEFIPPCPPGGDILKMFGLYLWSLRFIISFSVSYIKAFLSMLILLKLGLQFPNALSVNI